MGEMTRREILAAGARLAALPIIRNAPVPEESFSFVHLTDVHIQPELHATEGSAACFRLINQLNPAFAIVGGDLVYDAADVGAARAKQVFSLWKRTVADLQTPLFPVIGNHDVFGVGKSSGVSSTEPGYGKRMYEDLMGKRYYSFERHGWRFIALDSIFLTPEGSYVGQIDDEQIDWLKTTLQATSKSQPLVVLTHIPFATGFMQFVQRPAPQRMMEVANARDILDLLWPYNLKAVLQGHTHIREIIEYRHCKFITSGAVCGNWWKGSRDGHPEGFGLITVRNGELSWEYRTYGFVADPA